MENAAEYLLQFFNVEERCPDFDDTAAQAFRRMCEVQNCLDDLVAMGVRRLDTAQKVMPSIWSAVWESYALKRGDGGLGTFSMKRIRDIELKNEQIQALETIADKAPYLPFNFAAAKESISELLDEVMKALREDDTLPVDLRVYAVRMVNEVRRNIDEYSAGNDFDLRTALMQLFGVMYAAESQTSKPEPWRRILTGLAKTFISALLTEGTKQIASGTAAALYQIAMS